MRGLLGNLLLALVWAAWTGEMSAANIAAGLVVGFVVLVAGHATLGTAPYGLRARRLVVFAFFFLRELVAANLKVAYDVITPRHRMRPGVIAIPIDADTDEEITLLANLITLTPGTVSLDVAVDRRVLYVHAMYIDDPAALRSQIKNRLERRLLELLR